VEAIPPVANEGSLIATSLAHSLARWILSAVRDGMAFATLVYGFAALLLSYRVACQVVASAGRCWPRSVWWASSLPVTCISIPSWSQRALRIYGRAFFLVWLRTRGEPKSSPVVVLGLIAGLMIKYKPNAAVADLLIPEALGLP